MRTIDGMVALVALFATAKLSLADGSLNVVNDPADLKGQVEPNRRIQSKSNLNGFHDTRATTRLTRQLKKPHPWEDLINPSKPVPVPLADAHHAQSVLGKGGSKKQKNLPKMIAKGKFKGPRPIIEADDDEIYSGSNSSIVNKKGKQKKNESSFKQKLSKPTTSPTSYPTMTVVLTGTFPPSTIASTTGTPSAASQTEPTAAPVTPQVMPALENPTTPSPTTVAVVGAPVAAPVAATAPMSNATTVPATSNVTLAPATSNVTVAPATSNVTVAPATAPTNASNEMPSAPPSLNIIGAEKDLLSRSVKADPVFLSVTGDFDPQVEAVNFFGIIETNFNPYSRAYMGDLLSDFDIDIMFMNDLTQMMEGADGSPVTTSWCEVNVTFTVDGATESDLDEFTVQAASDFVMRFFMTSHKMRLISGLTASGIAISDMEAFPVLPDNIKDLWKSDSEQAKDGQKAASQSEENESSGESKSSLFVAVASGGVIFLALGAVLISRRRRYRFMDKIHDKQSITEDSRHSDGSAASQAVSFVSGERPSEVKPAALHVRNKREREREMMASSDSTISSFRTTETAQVDKATESKGYDDEAAYSTGQEADESAHVRLNDLIASSALNCLDGDESLGALNEAYPEFELYQTNASPPPSPVWSLDNYSNASPYSAEEEYVTARRRWHDEANDLEMIALPDTNSTGSESHHNRSVTDGSDASHRMDEV